MKKQSATPALPTFAERRRRLVFSSVQEMFFRHSSSVLLLFLVVDVEGGVGLLVIRDLRDSYVEVERICDGSVRGLRRIGESQYEAQETRRSTLYALTTGDANLQVSYADRSREADRRVTEGIAEYLAQARTPQELSLALYAASAKDEPWHDVRPLRVSDVVEYALRESSIVLERAGFTLEKEIQSGWPRVSGDLSVLSHCLRNLRVKAAKYGGESVGLHLGPYQPGQERQARSTDQCSRPWCGHRGCRFGPCV